MGALKIENTSWWVVILLAIGGFMLFTVLYGICQYAVEEIRFETSVPLGYALGIVLAASYAAMLRLFEGRWTTTLKFKKLPSQTAKGMAIGILYLLSACGLIALCGCYRTGEISFSRSLWKDLSFFFLVACGEEIMFRGILFRIIDKKWGTVTALITSALLFGGFHILNPEATLWSSAAIAIEAGLMLGIAYKCSGSLWMPIGIHWMWNFMEGPVLGFAVSGNDNSDSIFNPAIQGPELITGGAFGAEASIPAAALGIAVSLLIWHSYKKKQLH